MEDMLPRVVVVILNWNNTVDLAETVSSYEQQDYGNLHLLIVENGSRPEIREEVKQQYSKHDVLILSENNGWAGGNNAGIEHALGQQADYVLLSNNDISLPDSSLISQMVQNIQGPDLKDRVKILGVANYVYDHPDVLNNEGRNILPELERGGVPLNPFREAYKETFPDRYQVVDYVVGCFVMIEASVFRDVGTIDDALFLYGEDLDFCYRAWRKGYPSAVDKELKILHKISVSSEDNSPFQIYFLKRNMLYFLRNNKHEIPAGFRSRYFVSLLKTTILFWIRPAKYNGTSWKLTAALWKGIRHSLIGRMHRGD